MNNMVPGSFHLMKKINTGLILDTIRLKGPISRADIAKLLNLTPATVTNITAELIKQDVIVEGDLGESKGGRKPILIRINTDAYFIIAVHIATRKVRVALLNMESKILDCSSKDVLEDEPYEDVLNLIIETIGAIIEKNNIEWKRIIGIGAAINGLVDFLKGEIIFATGRNWENIKFKETLEKKLNIPVFVDSDVRTMALGESWYGEGKECDTFLCIKVGHSISMALVNNKQHIRGEINGLGEIGHMKIVEKGIKCTCGKEDCLEALASERAVKRYLEESNYKGSYDIKSIIRWVNEGNLVATSAVKEAGRYMGVGIANLINIFNPKMIIIGGELITLTDAYFNEALSAAKENSLPQLYDEVMIKRVSLNRDSIIEGSCVLVLDNLFDTLNE